MSKETRDAQLRGALERARTVNLPGSKKLKPVRLVHKVWGNGRQLVALQPRNTGPNYYVLRVDSSWRLADVGEGGSIFGDHLDEVVAAVVEQFGAAWYEGEPPATSRDNGRPFRPSKEDWGCTWFALRWPAGLKPSSITETARPADDIDSPAP